LTDSEIKDLVDKDDKAALVDYYGELYRRDWKKIARKLTMLGLRGLTA